MTSARVLSPGRASDRPRMAEELATLARSLGARVAMDQSPTDAIVRIRTWAGLNLWVQINAGARKGGYLLPWHMDIRTDRTMRPELFPAVNRYHYSKSTEWARDWSEVLERVRQVLAEINAGRAFRGEPFRVMFVRDDTGEVTAILPDLPANVDRHACYAHIGQHGECSKHWLGDNTRPATMAERADLLAELAGIYKSENIVIIKSL